MRQRRLITVPAVSASVVALGVTLLGPASSTAAELPGVAESTFTPALTYVDCPTGESLPARTRCAELNVPLDWQTPDDGRTINIAVRVTRGTKSTGGLTWNPGGPGGSAIDALNAVFGDMPQEVRNAFDIITWDPRGVGRSEPKLQGCSPQPSMNPPTTGPVDWLDYWQQYADVVGATSTECFEANSDVVPYIGTWQVIHDLDALRVALGYERWNYWGMSYGTRVGRAYAQTFPDSLRALIEDGSVMANESITRFGSMTPAGDYTTFQVFASIEGKRLAYKIRVVLDYLNDQTIEFGSAAITRWSFLSALDAYLRKPATIPVARGLVNQSYQYVQATSVGKQKRALRALRRITERATPDPVNDSYLIYFINCADFADRPTVVELASMSANAERNFGTAFGANVLRSAMCLGLPSGYSPPVGITDNTVSLANPPLFLLAAGDAGTPWVWGRSMANTFARARTVTLNSTEHVSAFRTPSTCVKDIAERYLLALERPRSDVFCPYAPYVEPAQ